MSFLSNNRSQPELHTIRMAIFFHELSRQFNQLIVFSPMFFPSHVSFELFAEFLVIEDAPPVRTHLSIEEVLFGVWLDSF